jgi:uncharacterized protein YutE (UPF0331/DUF86 family)
MNSINVVENKISAVQDYLTTLKPFKAYNLEQVKSDFLVKGALERYLYLAVQASIDLTEAFIAFKKFRKPMSYRESFEILKQEGVIDENLCESLKQMAGFRNVIAHDYTEVNLALCLLILNERLVDLEALIEKLRERL